MTVRANRGTQAARTSLRHVEECMGTAFSIHIARPGVHRWDLTLAMAWLQDMDALFSTYRETSQVSQLNAGTLKPADADDQVREVLAECERFRVLTEGFFDARYDGERIDPSGYVKGWAIRQVSEKLAAAGSTNHYVNGGGDVMCLGGPEPDRPWRIGVVDPHHSDTILRTIVSAGPIAVATSGLAERGAHIIDPHRRAVATDLASVTIAATDVVTADVFATAAVAMGADRAVAWLEQHDSITAVLVRADGTVIDLERR